jgi:adenosylcobinamide-GDP ribazoletransferase
VLDGLRLAVTTFTVLPVRGGRVDRRVAGTAVAVAPLVGVVLGAVLAGLAVGLRAVGVPVPVLAVAVVAAGVLATRALHLDGLADTADGLGSYAGADRALEIMKRSDIGPFGVVAVLLVLAGQLGAVGALAHRPAVPLVATLAAAYGTGRLAVTWACRRGVPAARPDGLGALVAGTVAWPVALAGTVALAALSVPAVPGRPWLGPVAVLVVVGGTALLVRHAVRRLGGITGDVLGGCVELGTTFALAVLSV